MIYCDKSLLIAALTEERHTKAAADWLILQAAGELVASAWVETEVASALALKVRTRQLDAERSSRAMQSWQAIRDMSFEIVTIEQRDFALATQLLQRSDLILRAGDALHVAIALSRGFGLATLDKTMASAASLAGVVVAPVIAPT